MGNSIAYFKAYINMLDKINQNGADTAILKGSNIEYKFIETNAKSILLQELTVTGLGTYTRSGGYPTTGDADLTWVEYTMAQDRAAKFTLDTLDSKQAPLDIMTVAAEFNRTKVIPEMDAYRFEKICTLCGLDVSADLTYDTALAAIDTGIETLDDAECPKGNRVMFVSNNMYKLMKNSGEFFNMRIASEMNGTINREITTFDDMPLIRVSAARFKNDFDFSATDGFSAAGSAKDINFIIADVNAIAAVEQYSKPKIITPEFNVDADAYVFGFRVFHDLFIPANKLENVYIHTKA